MHANYDEDVLLYERIAANIRQQIETGSLKPGEQLPTLSAIAEAWNVSLAPVRQAFALLTTEGLIATHRGAAATVAEAPGLVRIAPHRYQHGTNTTTYQAEAERAHLAVNVQHETITTTASPDIADRLGIESDQQLTQTDYLFTINKRPIGMSRCWEPLDITRNTDIEHPEQGPYAHLGIVGRFAQLGYQVHDIEEVLTFRPPSENETNRLDLSPSMWIVAIAQTFHANDRVVAVTDVTHRPDVYRAFVYRLPITTPDDKTPDPER